MKQDTSSLVGSNFIIVCLGFNSLAIHGSLSFYSKKFYFYHFNAFENCFFVIIRWKLHLIKINIFIPSLKNKHHWYSIEIFFQVIESSTIRFRKYFQHILFLNNLFQSLQTRSIECKDSTSTYFNIKGITISILNSQYR